MWFTSSSSKTFLLFLLILFVGRVTGAQTGAVLLSPTTAQTINQPSGTGLTLNCTNVFLCFPVNMNATGAP